MESKKDKEESSEMISDYQHESLSRDDSFSLEIDVEEKDGNKYINTGNNEE